MIILFIFSSILLLYNFGKIKNDYLDPLFGGLFLLYLYGVGGVGITYFVAQDYLNGYADNEILTASVYGFLCMVLYWLGFVFSKKIPQRIVDLEKSIFLCEGTTPVAYTLLTIGFVSGIFAMVYFSGSISLFLAHTDERQINSVGKTWILFFLMAVKWGFFVLISKQVKYSFFNSNFSKAIIGAGVFLLLLIWGRLFVIVFLVQLIIFYVASRKLSIGKFFMGAVSIFMVVFVAGIQRWMQGATEAKNIATISDTVNFALNNIDYKYLLLHNFFDGWYVYLGYIATAVRHEWSSWGAITIGSAFKVIPGMYGSFRDAFLNNTDKVLRDTYDIGMRASNLMGEIFLDFNFFGAVLFFLLGIFVAILYQRERIEKENTKKLNGSRFWSLLYVIVLSNFAIAIRTGSAAGFTWFFADICWFAICVFLLGRQRKNNFSI